MPAQKRGHRHDTLRASPRWRAGCLLVLLLAVALPALAKDARRALVIGNASYQHVSSLDNTLHDARDVSKALRAVGFTVTEAENATLSAVIEAVDDFVADLHHEGGTGLFYYSGHGVQVDGENYLVPVDAEFRKPSAFKYEAFALNDLLSRMGGRGAGSINLVVLDACRDNPFAAVRSLGSKGLASVEAPESTLILYATKPGHTASDNSGERNGLFTKHLLQAINKENADVEEAFGDVVAGVYHESNREQYPWKEGVLLHPFRFNTTAHIGVGTGFEAHPFTLGHDGSVPTGHATVIDLEMAVWEAANNCGRPACLQAYLDRYPEGAFAAIARAELSAPAETVVAAVRSSAPPQIDSVETQRLLAQCEAHFAADRLTTGSDGTALGCYREVLARVPGQPEAQHGIERITVRYLEWALVDLESGQLEKARMNWSKASMVQPDADIVQQVDQQISRYETLRADEEALLRRLRHME